jgi:hypothetical protein
MIRHAIRLLAVTTLVVGAGLFAVGGSDAAETGPLQTATFECTGAAQEWVVPADVHVATFDVFGAEGGVGDDGQLDEPAGNPGQGGHTKATIPVVPGETVQVNVGCAGANSGEFGSVAPGGFGGSPGGNGGAGGDLGNGGGGGGSSDVRQGGTALANRVVVAGGGGGSGGANSPVSGDGQGGDGGGESGLGGLAGTGANAEGGDPGTQSVNGAGGGITVDCQASGVAGQDGTDADGGDGGTDPTFGAGGGGGGGYHGGGGGAGCVNGGGGGGGAGFAMTGATGVVSEVGVQIGDGRVVVTFAAEIVELAPLLAG